VLDRGATGVHRALLLRTWSDDVTLLADGPAELSPDEAAALVATDVDVDERPVARLLGSGDALEAVRFADGSERRCEGLLVPVVLHQRSDLAARLGATLAEPGMLAADGVVVDEWFRTEVPGLFAPGDVTGDMPSAANAIAAGGKAGAAVVQDVVAERLPAIAGS
jgi:thioredoxin reductase